MHPSASSVWGREQQRKPLDTQQLESRGSPNEFSIRPANESGKSEAISLALMVKALMITSRPGVGKTTIINSILRILAAKGAKLLFCAPTGRAAKRMTEATGFEATTIHHILDVDPKNGWFKKKVENRIEL
jgi:ATP-dependent exoDNAse (exonuclease V) alpha subunit